MIVFTFLVLSAFSMHATATPEDTRIHIKMLESGGSMRDAGDLLMDVFHVVRSEQSEKGLVEWSALKDAPQQRQGGAPPPTAMLFRKKYLGSEFLGKRNLGSEFLGKRGYALTVNRANQMRNAFKNQQ